MFERSAPMKRKPSARFDPRDLGCQCDRCPLGQWYRDRGSFMPVPPEGPDDAEFLVIGEYPGTAEVQYQRPMIGPSGQILERTFNRLGITRGQLKITNSLLCRAQPRGDLDAFNATVTAALNAEVKEKNKGLPPSARVPKVPTPQEACRPHIDRLVEAASQRGAVVLALGKLAYWSVTGKKPKIMNVRGSFGEFARVGLDKQGRPQLAVYDEESKELLAGLPRVKLTASVNPALALKDGYAPYMDVLFRDVQRALRWHRNELQWDPPFPKKLRSAHPDARDLEDWLRRPGWYAWDIESAPGYPMESGRKDLDDHVQDSRENKLRILGIYDMQRDEAVVVPWVSIDGRTGFAPTWGRGFPKAGIPTALPSWIERDLRPDRWAEPSRTLLAPGVADQTEALRRDLTPWWRDDQFDDFYYKPDDGERVQGALRRWFEDPKAAKVGHFANYFDLGTMLRHLGPFQAQSMVDQILLARVWNSDLPRSLYFVGTMLTDVPAWKAGKDDRSVARDPRSQTELVSYNVVDCAVTGTTAKILVKNAEPHWDVVQLDHKVQAICLEMHQVGLWVHEPTRAELEQETRDKIKEEWDIVARVAGADFNPRSTKQLADLIYEQWKYPVMVLSPSGKPSTNEDAIRKLLTTPGMLEEDHRLMLEAIWRSRGLQKDLSDVILPMRVRSQGGIVHEDGVLRPDYTAHVPATGRISAGAPNTQNWRKKLRKIVRPRPGHLFLMADYDQIELRIMSAIAQVTAYLKVFADGGDPHAVTALLVYGEVFQRELDILAATGNKTEKFTALRRFAKTFVYAVLYGGTAETVYENVSKAVDDDGNLLFPDMGFRQVEAAVNTWMRNAREIPAWWAKTLRFAETFGFVQEPILKRRRHMPVFLRNEALNLPIQGGAGIIMGMGMIDAREVFEPDPVEGLGIVNQMHDALTVEVPESRALELAPVLTSRLTKTFPDVLPNMVFSATAEIAIDWSEKHWRAPGAQWDKAGAKIAKIIGGFKSDAAKTEVGAARVLEILRDLRAERILDQFKLHKLEAVLISAMKTEEKARNQR